MIRRLSNRVLFLLVTVMLTAACQWRDLDYDYINTADITVIFDWSQSGLKTKAQAVGAIEPGDRINGRTVAFYPVGGGDPIIKLSHSDTVNVNLLEGKYQAVFFNETFDDFDNIYFEGTEYFDQLRALAKSERISRMRGEIDVAREPDLLAVDMMIPLEVTDEMVSYTRGVRSKSTKALEMSMGMTRMMLIEEQMTIRPVPRSVVYPVQVEVEVHGMDDISSAGAYITGFAEGFDFSGNRPSDGTVIHKLTFSDTRFLDGSKTDGIMSGCLQTFGLRPGAGPLSGYTLEFRAVLINGEIYEETRSIDDLITEVTEDGIIRINIHIGSDKLPDGSDTPIQIPDVEPVGGDNGMWKVDVGDWEEITVPVDFPSDK